MVKFIIFVLLSFDGSSVSTARRGVALFMNPAGLGINPGCEEIYTFRTDPQPHNLSFLVGNFGMGAELKRGIKSSFTIGSGFRVHRSFWLGYNYKFGRSSRHELGGIFRPKSFASFGLVVPLEDETIIRGGVGIRPGTDRVTIFCDALYKPKEDSLRNLWYGIEPLDGIIFSFKADNLGTYDGMSLHLGLEISFGNLKVWGESDRSLEEGQVSVAVSKRRYPTLVPRDKKIVKLSIKGSYPEMKEEYIYLGLKTKREPAFYNLLRDIESLKKRKDVDALFIHFKPYSLGIAQVEELRHELIKVKELGIKIIAFSNGYGLGGYYLSCVADYIILTPLGDVVLPGILAKKMYLKGALEKLGVETDIEHIGKYKSAGEILEREKMSKEDREQIGAYLDDLWEPMVREIAKSRKIEENKLKEYINKEVFLNSDNALKFGLVDTLAYWYEIDDVLEKFLGEPLKRESMQKFLEKKELPRAWKEKPVIVSMGNVAGSGGYYISCFGDKIIADKFTLTGSIGVVNVHPILRGLYEKLGISWDVVKRGEHADYFSDLRHFTPEEREKFKQETEWFYDKFISRVSEGRGLEKAQVDSIAQGRIWSGTLAKRIGLVDEIGGLLHSIDTARKEAGIKEALR